MGFGNSKNGTGKSVANSNHKKNTPSGTNDSRSTSQSKHSSNNSSSNSSSQEKKKVQLQQRILQEYGGDIARGTQERMDKSIAALPLHMQMATELYRKISKWDAHVASLSMEQREKYILPRDWEGAEQARKQLQEIYERHGIQDRDIHNVFQKITWDASADAKAIRAIVGEMPEMIQQRVDRACDIIGNSVRSVKGRNGKCLDVGCGHGVLVKHLVKAGILPGQYYGVDLSTEMIRNAKETYRGFNFIEADFLQETFSSLLVDPSYPPSGNNGFDGIIFCSSLHDLPDISLALQKASSLLREGGKIVIVHPQGATHVISQHKANPTMVRRSLPTAHELEEFATSMNLKLDHAPADSSTQEDMDMGYLAVLSKECKVSIDSQ